MSNIVDQPAFIDYVPNSTMFPIYKTTFNQGFGQQ